MRGSCLVVGVMIVLIGLWRACAAQAEQHATGKALSESDVIQRGKYLANDVAHCSHCHTPQTDKGEPDHDRLLRGATLPIQPKKKSKHWADKSPNITADGIASEWSEAGMVKFLMTGVNPDGEKPTPPMPVFHLHEDDARAIARYLRSLSAKKHQTAQPKGETPND